MITTSLNRLIVSVVRDRTYESEFLYIVEANCWEAYENKAGYSGVLKQ